MKPDDPAEQRLRVSLGKRLRRVGAFACYGVKPNWDDYPAAEQEAILDAEEVFYPSHLYEDLLQALGKVTFPRNYYPFLGNKVRQTSLFQLLEIPHPRTQIYYGRNRLTRIVADFPYPYYCQGAGGLFHGRGCVPDSKSG